MHLRVLIALLLSCGSMSFSQGYYPLNVGNQWDYGEIDFLTPGQLHYLYSVHVVGDTTMPNGKTYAILQGDFAGKFLRQSGSRVYSFASDTEAVVYDFALGQGDTLSLSRTDTFYTLVRVNLGTSQVFGKTWNTWNYDKTTNRGYDGGHSIAIADSVGRTYTSIDPGYTDYLMGAVIDGKRYGTVTQIRTPSAFRPSEFRLLQNYPNPFNPRTTITYNLPKAAHVTLTVYDMLGREVSVLVQEQKNAGVYDVRFDGGGLGSGVYFYRLQAGDFTQTKRLLLLK